MNEDDTRLVDTGALLARTLYAHGLGAGHRLLDVGCGYGRLAIGLMSTGYEGRYKGFDILPLQVRWCRRHLTPADDRYRFRHLDVHNARYNATGTIEAAAVRFPARDESHDYCALFSVFTHFYADDVRRYLAEIRRVLVPGGRAVTTWFVWDDARLPAITAESSAYPMVHVLDEVTRYETESDPLKAIAYREDFVRELVRGAGLEVETLVRGRWAHDGPDPEQFQDLLVLRRPPLGTATRIRRRLGRLRRRLVRAGRG